MFVSVVSVLQYTETESFGISIEPKQTEEQLKQFDKANFGNFSENLGLFRFVSVCFSLFLLFHFYTETESFDVSIEPKQTKEQPKKFDREHILACFIKFYGCFGLFRNSTVCFSCFDIGSKHRNKPNKPKFFVFGFTKQSETQPKQILFRFVSVRTEFFGYFEDTLVGARITPIAVLGED